MIGTEEASGRDERPGPARLVGRLLGCEQAWENGGTGHCADDDDRPALARSRWEAEGRALAGTEACYAIFLQGFLEGYATELAA